MWYENTGSGFTQHVIQPTINGNHDGLDIGDMDLDGDLDIVVCNYGGSIRLYENIGGGGFNPWVIDSVNITSADLPFIVDIDDDSCPDIVMSDNRTDGHTVLYHQICQPGIEETEANLRKDFSCKTFPTPAARRVNFFLSIPERRFFAYNQNDRGDGRCTLKIYNIVGELVYESQQKESLFLFWGLFSCINWCRFSYSV